MFTENIIQPFIKAVEDFGEYNAFCIDGKFYTYNEFSKQISKICHLLQSENITMKNIGLIVNDDIETYATIFAIWLEGYTYVPLHPQHPVERSLEIISQAGINLIISSGDVQLANVHTLRSTNIDYEEIVLKPKAVSDDEFAYILFTSGSTGKPKGVPINRRSIGAFMKSFWEIGFEITKNDRCLQCFDLTFDVSVQSFLVPLTKGACTYTVPHNKIKYSYVYGLLEEHELTFGAMAPSMVRFLRPYFDEIRIPSMRYNILTAEASPLDLVSEWANCIPNAEIYDFYGPTEATIYCTYYRFNRGGVNKHYNGMLSIGKVMNGISALIKDESGNILGPNQKGELCITGDQLTTGYWNNTEKSAASFFEMKREGKTCRYYKTGDSCIIDDEGDILYSGRLDSQVKIQGNRIELGEIEFHACEFLAGLNTVAVAYENLIGNNEIALFIEGESADTKSLIDYLKSIMPNYMIPSKILIRKEFPLNANGKIDRNTLKRSII